MSMKLDAESYLKSGSNELRVLEYRTCGMSFGINILKVSKIVSNLDNCTSVPESHPSVTGMFKDMNRLIPVVDLADFLGIQCESKKLAKVIVTEFFGMQTGFWVHSIDWIHHFRWEQVIDAQDVFSGINQRYVIGIVKPTEDHMVLLLDYETILLDLCPRLAEKNTQVPVGSHSGFQNKRVLVAEDSPAVRLMLVDQITQQGGIVVEASDGQHAWEQFGKQPFDLVISDVEMPQVDGLALTLNIRQSDRPNTPVIVYSSIGDVGMKARAAYLKADAHITKLNFEELMQVAEKLMRGEKLDHSGFQDVAEEEVTRTVPV
jgi:two-component system, chemotaxis family, chemotaxis protein CheV